jgi:hypothetical protein
MIFDFESRTERFCSLEVGAATGYNASLNGDNQGLAALTSISSLTVARVIPQYSIRRASSD